MDKKINRMVWVARGLVGLVAFSNLLAAIPFLITPQGFAPAFELGGDVGDAVIRGFGVLFLMWTIPYLVAAFHPQRHFTSLVEAVIMQAIGVTGESLILLLMPKEHITLTASVTRFIYFDAAGLIFLLIALGLMIHLRKKLLHHS